MTHTSNPTIEPKYEIKRHYLPPEYHKLYRLIQNCTAVYLELIPELKIKKKI